MPIAFDPAMLLGAAAGAAAMLVCSVAVALFKARRAAAPARAAEAGGSETDIRRLFEQVDLALYELRGHSELMEKMSGKLDAIAVRFDSQARQGSAPAGARGYDTAIRMARTGASSDELVAAGGVTRQEARLLTRLHGREKKSA